MKKTLFSILIVLLSYFISSGQNLTIMSVNIRYDNDYDLENSWKERREDVVKLITKNQPTILGIQEGLLHQLEYIDSSLVNYTYIGVGRGDGIEKGEFSPIFYDTTIYEVTNISTFWLSESQDTASVGWDAALERICSYGLFENRSTKKKFWVFNTHFDHIGKKARAKSASLILQIISDVNSNNLPLLLMGDLNSTPKEKPIRILEKEMSNSTEVSATIESDFSYTYNGFSDEDEMKRIDYIFIKGMDVLSYIVIEDRRENGNFISDHFPIVIRVK